MIVFPRFSLPYQCLFDWDKLARTSTCFTARSCEFYFSITKTFRSPIPAQTGTIDALPPNFGTRPCQTRISTQAIPQRQGSPTPRSGGVASSPKNYRRIKYRVIHHSLTVLLCMVRKTKRKYIFIGFGIAMLWVGQPRHERESAGRGRGGELI